MVGSKKTVLVLSDDAVGVYSPVRGRFAFLGEVKWQDPELLSTLSDILASKGHSRPLVILYDMVEQYYRKEIVPKVAFLDQRRVIERRLRGAFTNYPLRGYLPLKQDKKSTMMSAPERGEKTAHVADGMPYLFAALPDHDHMARLIESIRLSMTVSRGLALLPIESVSMVRQISTTLNGHAPDPDRWVILIAQHRGGGLRQIVVRNGELALTRLTPIVDTDIEPNIWASEVVQEFSATMGYLSRFGYNVNSELEVIVLGNRNAIDLLEPQIKATQFHGLSVQEAARLLRLGIESDEYLRYADVLYAAWVARKTRLTLPFKIKELSFISQARIISRSVATLASLAVVVGVFYVGSHLWTLYESQRTIADMKEKYARLESEYQAELERKESFGIDVKLVQGSISVFEALEKNRVDILKFLQTVAEATGPDLAYDAIEMRYEIVDQENPDPMAIQTIQKRRFISKLNMSFPVTMLPEVGNKLVSDLRDRIAKSLVGFDVEVEQPVRDLTFLSPFNYRAGGGDTTNMETGSGNGRLSAIIGIRQREAVE